MTHPLKILVVDDEPLSRSLLARSIERAGFEVLECKDGVEAFQMIEELGPCLLVLDYEMPELNGAQICEILRKDPNPEIAEAPIIFLTAHSGEEHEVECLRAGANDFVIKPVNPAVLRARIETHLHLWALRKRLQSQNEELARRQREQDLDLEAARLTQQAIIPQRMPPLLGWSFAARFRPLIQVGGDMYDWFRLPDGGSLFWIADATGHGASAALHTALTKLLFRHASAESGSPAAIMESVGAEFHEIFDGKSYMTAMCLVLRPGSGAAVVCGAGHPPLLIARADGRVESIASSGPPLGIAHDLTREEEAFELGKGDAFVMYTDGFYGLMNSVGQRLQQSELSQLLPAPGDSAEEFLAAILRRLDGYAEGQPMPDDVAAVAGLRKVDS